MPAAPPRGRPGLALILTGILLVLLGLGRSAWSILAAPLPAPQAALPVQADPAAILYRHAVTAGQPGPEPEAPGRPAEDGFTAPPPGPAQAGQAPGLADDTLTPARRPLQSGPPPLPLPPVRLVIPAIGLDALVVPAVLQQVSLGGSPTEQWLAPDQAAAGWHTTSARLGEPGNTILNGHHNEFGEVFRRLVDLKVGDTILVYSAENAHTYTIVNRLILLEAGQSLAVRLENARWIGPTLDERLTLVTCWPYSTNTHRLVLVARPGGNK